MVYYDNAATSYPKPREVVRAVDEALIYYGANPGRAGHDMSLQTSEAIFRCRSLLAAEMGLSAPERVIFTHNCTTAINIVIKGILKAGDHVIISALEHNAVARTVNRMKNRGVSYSVADVFPGNDKRTVDSFISLIRPNTKLIACTHASNVFGITLPVEEIAHRAKKHGIMMLVDAAQSGGVLPIDMEKMDIDFLALAGHKGLYAPMGIGALLLGSSHSLDSFCEGGTGSNSVSLEQPEVLPDRFESGTLNVPGICGLRAGLEVLRERKRERVLFHEIAQLQEIYDGLNSMDRIILYTARPTPDGCAPVLSMNMEGVDSESLASRLNEYGIAVRAGLHCAPMAHKYMGTLKSGTVRIAPSYMNTRREIEYFLECIKKIAVDI